MSAKPTFAIASDHAGYRYKQAIIAHLQNQGYTVKDFGTHTPAASHTSKNT